MLLCECVHRSIFIKITSYLLLLLLIKLVYPRVFAAKWCLNWISSENHTSLIPLSDGIASKATSWHAGFSDFSYAQRFVSQLVSFCQLPANDFVKVVWGDSRTLAATPMWGMSKFVFCAWLNLYSCGHLSEQTAIISISPSPYKVCQIDKSY